MQLKQATFGVKYDKFSLGALVLVGTGGKNNAKVCSTGFTVPTPNAGRSAEILSME